MELSGVVGGSRGKVAAEIRRGNTTVGEIAAALDMTPNNVRAHLAALQRDGIVELSGSRRGFRKPTLTYRLTPRAERLFSVAYEPVLVELVRALESKVDSTLLFREVGNRLAANVGSLEGLTIDERLEVLATTLRSLGASAAVATEGDRLVIKGNQCPLASIVAICPEACEIVRTATAIILGIEVTERCVREPKPACCFEARLAS
jgi:predicted ArsR family transcriptional regulator